MGSGRQAGQQRRQELPESTKRLPAVTHGVFLLGRHFRGGHARLLDPEMRVVAKAVGTSRLVDDATFDGAFGRG